MMAESIKPGGADVFTDPWNKAVYRGIAATWKKYGHCDCILLRSWMASPAGSEAGAPWENPASCEGSLADLTRVLDSVPSYVHGVAYGQVLLHIWRCRMTYAMASKLEAAALAHASLDAFRSIIGEVKVAYSEYPPMDLRSGGTDPDNSMGGDGRERGAL